MSNVNSYGRESIYDQVPLSLFAGAFGWDVVQKLGLSLVPANQIILKPELLKRRSNNEQA
jgi:hypothetical protein